MSPRLHGLLAGAGGLSGVAIGLAVASVAFVAIRSLTRDLWQLPFVYRQRPGTTAWIGVPLAVVSYLVGGVLLGHRHPGAALFGVLALVPWLAVRLVTVVAWRTDDEATRAAALEVRAAEAARLGEPPPSPLRRLPWRHYLFDVERALRRARYEPPPV